MRLEPFTVRITEQQRARLERAASLISERRGQIVPLAVAMRELALEGAERLIRQSDEAA